jgi:uncharacterized protein YecE (DUF72 family)
LPRAQLSCARSSSRHSIAKSRERPFQTNQLTADWTFIRVHAGARGLRCDDSDSELEEWAQRIEDWRRSRGVFAYFNNDREAFAIKNAARLKERLGV